MDKLPFMCLLLLSLAVSSVAAPVILPVKAAEVIYIRADGTVEGTNKISQDGNIYTFAGDIFESVVVEKDDVVVDGAGYSLQGTGVGTGISLNGRTNVKVQNMKISNFLYGIVLDSSLKET